MNLSDLIDPSFSWRLITTLVHFLWQGSLVAILALIGDALLSRSSASRRYTLHVAALMLMIGCVVFTFWNVTSPVSGPSGGLSWGPKDSITGPGVPGPDGLPPSGLPTDLIPEPFGMEAPVPVAAIKRTELPVDPPGRPATAGDLWQQLQHYAPQIALLYFACCGLLLARLARGTWLAHRLRGRVTQVRDESLIATLQEQAKELGLRIVPKIAWCAEVSIPLVIGVIHPMILLPAAAATGLSPVQLQALITHELAHIRRYDLLVNMVQRIVESILFFHPAVWFISRRISSEREQACDELVLASGCERLRYADALVRMAELSSSLRGLGTTTPATSLAAAGSSSSEFKRRVLKILSVPTTSHLRPSRIALLVTMALIVGVAGYASGLHAHLLAGVQPNSTPTETMAPEGLEFLKMDVASNDQQLADIVRDFNAENKQLGRGVGQAELTVDEIIGVIKQDKWARGNPWSLNEKEIAAFKSVAGSKRLPKGSRLDVHTEIRGETFLFTQLWQVHLMLPAMGHDGLVGLTIRDTRIVDEKIDPTQVAWGKPDADGLVLGAYFSPRKANYALGERVRLRLFVRNDGSRTVDGLTFYNLTTPAVDDFTVTDETGAKVAVRLGHDDWSLHLPAGATTGVLAPGGVHAFNIPFELAIGGKELQNRLIGRVISARPGQKLQLKVRAHNGSDRLKAKNEPRPESGTISFTVTDASLPEGLEFLKAYPKLQGLSLEMTEPQFLEIVRQQGLKSQKTVNDEMATHHIPLGDGLTLIVMFSKDGKCKGIQRIRGEYTKPESPDSQTESNSKGTRVLRKPAILLPDHWIMQAVGFDRGGKELVTASNQGFATIRRWDVGGLKLISEIKLQADKHGRKFRQGTLKFSGDRKRIVAATDAYVGIWDTTTGKLLKQLPFPKKEGIYDCAIDMLDCTPDLSVIVGHRALPGRLTLSFDAHVLVWDADTGKVLRTVIDKGATDLKALDLSTDGKRLVTTNGGGAKIWETSSGQLLRTIENDNKGRLHSEPDVSSQYTSHVWSVQLSPDGNQVAMGDILGVKLIDVETGKLLQSLEGPYRYSSSGSPGLVFSPDGRRLARLGTQVKGDGDKHRYVVPIWSTRTGAKLFELHTEANDAAISDDGQFLAVGFSDMQQALSIWSLSPAGPDGVQTSGPGPHSRIDRVEENGHHIGKKAAEYIEKFKPTWGEPKFGLQYGIALTKPQKQFRSGERVPLVVFFRNTSDKPIKFDTAPDFFGNPPKVVNAKGEPLSFENIPLLGTIPHYHETLQPGEALGPFYLSIGLGENRRPNQQNWYPYLKDPVPGTYSLTHSVSIHVQNQVGISQERPMAQSGEGVGPFHLSIGFGENPGSQQQYARPNLQGPVGDLYPATNWVSVHVPALNVNAASKRDQITSSTIVFEIVR